MYNYISNEHICWNQEHILMSFINEHGADDGVIGNESVARHTLKNMMIWQSTTYFIWWVPPQHCCKNAYQIAQRSDNFKLTSRDCGVSKFIEMWWENFLPPDALDMFCIVPWRHQMGTFSALLALCEGNPPVTVGLPSQRPATRIFGVFFDVSLKKRLNKQSRC